MVIKNSHNKAVHSEQFFRRFFCGGRYAATKNQLQNCCVTAALNAGNELMLVFRNTAKLSKELGLRKSEIIETDDEGFLGSWFCNLVLVGRRKCLVFCHSKTLYCFFVPCIVKKDLSSFPELFLKNLVSNLAYEGFSEVTIENLTKAYAQGAINSKTNNRSVLGSMNDYAYLFEAYVEPLGPAKCDILAVNQKINTAPMSALKYSSGINEFRRLLMRVSI